MLLAITAKQIDEQTLCDFGEVFREVDGADRVVWRQVRARSVAGDDAPRHRHLDDGSTAAAGSKVHACQLGVCVHGRTAHVGDPSGRFTVDEFD